ncbi:MAG: cytochrome c oxidase accessory protein CcoG [Planctomycetota bacterium]|nr:MAG: cytochrome c oxidase accessory protein CcoG [Planctomycetota bacterium]
MSDPEREAHEKATLLQPPERVLATLNADGTRRWIRPRLSRGRYYLLRRSLAWVLMVVFVAVPHLRVGGAPLILLDIPAREFTLFGTVFRPTDTALLMLLLLGILVGIFLVTALLGRAWCGWACPQTVYMEFLFRPLERLFEGSPQEQQKLDRVGGSWRRWLKNAVFALIACFLAHTFLAYFVGWEQLIRWIRGSPAEHPVAFLVMAGVTAAMVFDFLWFREQTCLVACPYGRFQSVLLDRDSLIVGYDVARGEPRGKPGKRRKGLPLADEDAKARGDCIDCRACVLTCPTGIDIRDGLQMECIHCTQCIDACDAIMERIGRPKGLVRYCSQRELSGEGRRILRPRVLVYAGLLLVFATLLAIGLSRRGGARVTVLRGLREPFSELPTGEVVNQVRVKIGNQTRESRSYRIAVEGLAPDQVVAPENPLPVAAGALRETTLFIKLPEAVFHGTGKKVVAIVVEDGAGFRARTEATLLGPKE